MAVRANDGSNAADAYRPKTKPGGYVPTPAVVGSAWPNVKPFAMTAPAQFRPQPPVFLHSEQWAADYNEIKELGGKTSAQTLGAADRGCALLADHRAAEHRSDRAPTGRCPQDEPDRQRALHGAHRGRAG